MLNINQLEKYADVMIWAMENSRSKSFKPYDKIILHYDTTALPLAELIHKRIVEKKWIPIIRTLLTPTMEHDYYSLSDQKQRKFLGTWDKDMYDNLNGFIYLSAPVSLTHLKNVNPKNISETRKTRKPLYEIRQKREEKGQFSWTLCTYPTEEPAKLAKLSLKEFTDQIVKACYLDEKDPIKIWQEFNNQSKEIIKWLNSLPIDSIHLESKSCDLTVKLGEKRQFVGFSGNNIPSFEIFTSPDFRGTNGIYYADLPSFKNGNYIEGIKLEFKKGNVINSTAKKGEKFLQETIATDAGSKRLGEFSLTDKRFSKINKFMADTLFDENYGGQFGNCHIAIGSSYTDTYKGNPANLTKKMKKDLGYNDSAEHWDIINIEDKTATALLKNGKKVKIYEKGMFNY